MNLWREANDAGEVPADSERGKDRGDPGDGESAEPSREAPDERSWTSRAPKVFRVAGLLGPIGLPSGLPRHAYSEFAGERGLEATRYGDWEYSGRCTDF